MMNGELLSHKTDGVIGMRLTVYQGAMNELSEDFICHIILHELAHLLLAGDGHKTPPGGWTSMYSDANQYHHWLMVQPGPNGEPSPMEELLRCLFPEKSDDFYRYAQYAGTEGSPVFNSVDPEDVRNALDEIGGFLLN